MNKSFVKKIAIVLLGTVMLAGCTTSNEIVRMQNEEIRELQKIRAQIIARPAFTAKEKLAKRADLKEINMQIDQSMKTAMQAQTLSDSQTENAIGTVLTGAGAVLGTAAVIHHITK